MRPSSEPVIRPLAMHESDAISAASTLLNRTQGVGLFDPGYLERHLQSSRSLVVGAFLDDVLVGVGVAEILDTLDYYRPFDADLPSELAGQVVGSFTTLSVLESHQGRGLGRRISDVRLRWLVERACDVALGVSWVSGSRHTSAWTFERAGFRRVKELPDFYRASSIEKPFDCPACHAIPCVCGAILYRKDFAV